MMEDAAAAERSAARRDGMTVGAVSSIGIFVAGSIDVALSPWGGSLRAGRLSAVDATAAMPRGRRGERGDPRGGDGCGGHPCPVGGARAQLWWIRRAT